MNSDRIFYDRLLLFLENKAHLLIIISTLIILVVTLLPFDFSIPYGFSLSYVLNTFNQGAGLVDIIVNIILFVPFGLGLAALLSKKNQLSILGIIFIILASLFLSLTVEISQLFLISRKPAFADLLTNSFGGLSGAIIFCFLKRFQSQLSYRLAFLNIFTDSYIQLKTFIILWLSYLLLISLLLITVQDSTKLSNWDSEFPLIIGNEATGDRSWSGKISELCITEKSLTNQQIIQLLKTENSCSTLEQNSDNLITAYSFLNSQISYPELTQNIPSLKNQEAVVTPVTNLGIIVNQNNWLTTKLPATKLTEKIKNSSQFTIFTNIATASLKQEGPARIISLSKNQFWRNFTIGQWRKDLILRLRMPLTGGNGQKPEIRINDFFTDTKLHQLAIAYDGIRLRFYTDRGQKLKSLYLGSEAALFWSIFAVLTDKMYLNTGHDAFYHLLYYGFIFAPLGFLLGLIFNLLQTRFLGLLSLIVGGLIAPPFIIQDIIVSSSNTTWNWSYLSLGIAVITISFLVSKFWQTKTN